MSASSVPDVEGVIVISSDVLPSEHFIRMILDMDTLPTANVSSNNVKGYPWQFETKYYSAEVMLYAVEEKLTFEPDFLNSVKATILCFDSDKLSSFEEILSWMPLLENIESEVQLLVCNNCCNKSGMTAPIRKNVLNWCIENHFELVELNPDEESDAEDDTLTDVKGYARIVQALQSHTWANLVMKNENPTACKKTKKDCQSEITKKPEAGEDNSDTFVISKLENEEASGDAAAASENTQKDSKKMQVDNEELLLEEKLLENVLSGDDPGGESFEALFSKFASMKDKASGLTGEDRKKYAEKVAIAFWRAMGGDEDEIDGLDDE